jgi:iron complex outermembrane receptor protein
MRKAIIAATALAAALVLALPAWAQEAQPETGEVYTLGEVVVSADKPTVKSISLSSEVSAGDIDASHALTVPQALEYAPGVTVTTGRKNEPEIRIHGFQQQQTLILIDGVPYYETNYGKLNLNQIPTDMIARIDVIKGAPSVIYGPNALAGVINIITKKAGQRPVVAAKAEAGQNSAVHGSFSHGQTLGKFNYWLNYNHREADGWEMSDNFEPVDGAIVNRPGRTVTTELEDGGERNNSDYRSDSLWGRVGWEPRPGTDIYLSGYYIDSEWGFPPSLHEERVFRFRPAFSGLARMETYRDYGADLSASHELGESWTLRAKLFYHHHVDDYVSYGDLDYSEKLATSRFEDYAAGGALYADWRVHPTDTLRFAFHYKGDSHQERDDEYLPFAEDFSYTGSLAAENEWRPTQALAVVVGASYDWFTVDQAEAVETDRSGDFVRIEDQPTPEDNDAFNPMIGVTYTFADATQLFGSVARKTRFPTLQQLFSSRSGNLELDPERATNYTLGVRRPFLDGRLDTRLAVFYHDIEDMISRDGPDIDDKYRNYAEIRMVGFEAGASVNPLAGLWLHLDYTYNDAEDNSPDNVTDKVIGAPEHKLDFRASYTVPRLGTRLDLQTLFISETYDQVPTPARPDQETLKTDGYTLANFKVTQPIWGEKLQAFGFVNNITDRDYESEYGYPGPGRSFWLGLKTRFQL